MARLLGRAAPPCWPPSSLAGCGREEVRVYQAPKDQAAAPVATDPHAGLDMSAGLAAAASPRGPTSSPLKWQTPDGWKEQPSGQMRVGFFAFTGENNQKAEVTIIPLSGLAGSDLDNVNRWLGQLGAPPVTGEQLASLAENADRGRQRGPALRPARPGIRDRPQAHPRRGAPPRRHRLVLQDDRRRRPGRRPKTGLRRVSGNGALRGTAPAPAE